MSDCRPRLPGSATSAERRSSSTAAGGETSSPGRRSPPDHSGSAPGSRRSRRGPDEAGDGAGARGCVERSRPRSADRGRESDGRGSVPSGRTAFDPDRLPVDDVLDRRPDRQILVVGDTVVGLTLTLLLRRAGYDPLLVSGAGAPARSRVSHLSPPVLAVLDAVGVGTRLRDRAVTVGSVSVRTPPLPDGSRTVLPADEAPEGARPAVVRTRRLRRALEERLPDRQRRADRAVDGLSRREGGLVVDFGDGIREWFDVVVDAGGGGASLRPTGHGPPESDALAQYETRVESDALPRDQLRDVWLPDALVQYAPRPGEPGGVLRVTAPRSALEAVSRDGTTGSRHGGGVLLDELGSIPSDRVESGSTTVRQLRLPDGAGRGEWWGVGRVSFCGPAACPVAPASGFAVSWGVEDAVAFVTALDGPARSASGVVDAYASGRTGRPAALRRATDAAAPDHEYPLPRPAHPSLASLGVLRHVALGSFLGERLRAVREAGFGEGPRGGS